MDYSKFIFLILRPEFLGHQFSPHGQHSWVRTRSVQTSLNWARVVFEFGKSQQKECEIAPVGP